VGDALAWLNDQGNVFLVELDEGKQLGAPLDILATKPNRR